MKTDPIRPLLNPLADGELSGWTAARVRRHLKTCAGCRTEYGAIQALGVEAQAWRSVSVPAGFSARLAEAISLSSSPLPFAPPHSRTAVRWRTLVGAGALGAALVAIALIFPGSLGHPNVAFADVRKAMQSVKAVSWVQTQTRYDLRGTPTLRNTQRVWVRREPAAYAEQDSVSSLAQVPDGEYAGPRRYVSTAYGQVNFHVQDGVYYLHPPQDITRQVQDTITDLTASRADAYNTPQRGTLNGRPALRFHQHSVNYDQTVWTDPRTLRVERKITNLITDSPSGQERIVLDATDFQYDAPTPAGVFDLAPPIGAHVTEDDGKGNKTMIAPIAPGSKPHRK
jgi:hypothetical protein